MVRKTENYSWSSAQAHCGQRQDTELTTNSSWRRQDEYCRISLSGDRGKTRIKGTVHFYFTYYLHKRRRIAETGMQMAYETRLS